jgi:flagellar assembly protein FliH
MRLSKRIINSSETDELVLSYQAQPFSAELSVAAKKFVRKQPISSKGFEIDPTLAEHTGIAESERQLLEERVEVKALEHLKGIQEEAYKEAYQLGLEEGREKAFQEYKEKFEENFRAWEILLKNIEGMKETLLEQHERSLVQMLFHFASKIARKEIQEQPELIIETLRDCIKRTQGEENLRVVVSPSDLEFLKVAAQRVGRDQNFLKRIQLESSEEIEPGGCVVESNFGQVDATLETRIGKLWELIEGQLPPARSEIKAS